MAYTTDRTWVAAEVPTASQFNTYLRDNMKWLSTDKPMYKGYGGQTLTSGTEADYVMSTESFDNAGLHSTTVSNGQVTIATAGTYLFGAVIEFDANTTGLRSVAVQVNGATYLAEDTVQAHTGQTGVTVTTLYAMSASDYITYRVWQNSGTGVGAGSSVDAGNAWALWAGV